MIWRRLLLVSLLATACGDAVVDGDYRGEPHLRVEGVFRGNTGDATIRSPHLGILWSTPWFEQRLEATLTPILATPLSSNFSFEIWDLPPISATFLDPFCGAWLALGTFVVYDDVDENGRVEMELEDEGLRILAPDTALGLGEVHYLLYTNRALEGCEPFPDLDAGFHVILAYDGWVGRSEKAYVEISLFPPQEFFPFSVEEELRSGSSP